MWDITTGTTEKTTKSWTRFSHALFCSRPYFLLSRFMTDSALSPMKCHRLSLANRCLSHNAHLTFGMKSLWEHSNPYYKNLFSYLKMSMPWFEKVCFPRYTFSVSLFSWQCSSEAGRLYVSWVCRRNQLWINTNTSSESTRRRGLELFWFYLSLLLLFLNNFRNIKIYWNSWEE